MGIQIGINAMIVGDADTVDGYHLDQALLKGSSPQFAHVKTRELCLHKLADIEKYIALKVNDVSPPDDKYSLKLNLNNATRALGITDDVVLPEGGVSLPNTIANVLTDHNKAVHDLLTLDHGELSNVTANQHHTPPTGALSLKVITSNRILTDASGDVAYTGAGFLPKGIMGIGAISGGTHVILNTGWSDGTMHKVKATWGHSLTSCVLSAFLFDVVTSAGNYQTAIVKSFDADGVTLTWVKTGTPAGTFLFSLIFLG